MDAAIGQTFTPLNYSPAVFTENQDEDSIDTVEGFDEIVTKGGKKVFKVDIGHFDNLCKKFQNKCDIPIKHLSGTDKEDFKLMVSYVRLLYGTNYYEHLHKKVVKYFGGLEHVQPGTVGGYFGGCLVSTSFDNQPGCSVLCAGAVPRPKDEEGWSFCDRAVIFAERKRGGYDFTMLREPEHPDEMDPCYLFVEHTNLHDFSGFDKKEKDKLRDLGVDNLYLIGCDADGTEYVNLYDDVCNLYDIKHRRRKSTESDNSNVGLALVLIVVFLLLVAVLFGWRFWEKDYTITK